MLPNPNVLIEYGWALKSISYSRIIPVMNTAFGEPTSENMPFDMRHLRNPIKYHLPADSKENGKVSAKNKLIKMLSDAIEAILHSGVVGELLPKPHIVEQFAFDNPSMFCSATEPLTIISDLHGADNKIFIPNTESLFLRIIPVKQADAIKSSKEAYETLTSGRLMAMGRNEQDSYSHSERNKHGAFVCKYKDNEVVNLTQLFLSKQIWGLDLYTINKAKLMKFANVQFGFFPSVAIEEVFNAALDNYLKFATKTLGLSFPLKYIAGAAGVEGYKMTGKNRGFPNFDGRVVNKNIVYEGQITDYNQKTTDMLRPLFNHIWQECGLDRPDVEYLR